MAMSSKVFIYNAKGASSPSAEDLKELFSSKNIFVKKPDVQLSDFNFDPSGLSTPTFVVPGGSTIALSHYIKPRIDKMRGIIKNDFNYVGICAGAFIGANSADLFHTSHQYNDQQESLDEPSFLFTIDENMNLNLVTDYKAVGAFYPHDGHKNPAPKKQYMPYRVNLTLAETKEDLPQLYVSGPGFFSTNRRPQSSVVATYADCNTYTFPYEKEKMQINSFPAMISSKPSEGKGGVFLSGTHIETCVPNSKLLTFFKSPGLQNAPLNALDVSALEQAEARATVESLLSKSLK